MMRMLTRPELEDMLQISGASIYRLVKLEQFPPPLKIGLAAVRWHPDDVRDWLESRPKITELDGNS